MSRPILKADSTVKQGEALDTAMEGIFQKNAVRVGSVDHGEKGIVSVEDTEKSDRQLVARRTAEHEEEETLVASHSVHDFAHNHPIMTKLKTSSHRAHKKTTDPADSVRKKQRKASENLNDPGQVIHEGLELERLDEGGVSALPWHRPRLGENETVLRSEFAKGIPGGEAIPDTGESGWGYLGPGQDEAEEAKEEEATTMRKTGVMFSIGDDYEEVDENEGRKEHPKIKHKSSRGNETKGERRQGSDIPTRENRRPVTPEEEPAVTELDMDDIGTRRFEKSKGLMKHKIEKSRMGVQVRKIEEVILV